MAFIGIDLGTTFIKGAVLDLDALELRAIERVPFPGALPGLPAGFHEVDPGTVVEATSALIDRLLDRLPGCEGLVSCSQMHTLVLADRDGRALSNCITWRDQRALSPHPGGSGSHFEVVRELLSAAELEVLGNELKPGSPICFLPWFVAEGRLPAAGAIPASLPDFVLARLCGTAPRHIDHTSAASHGLLDLSTLDWHVEVIRRLGLDSLDWPRPAAFCDAVYELHRGGRVLPCFLPAGDHQVSLAGTFLSEGELSVNVSTGSQVSLLRSDLRPGDFQTRPFFDGRFLNTVTHIPAGRALDLLMRLLCEIGRARGVEPDDPWGYVAGEAAGVAEPEMSVLLSFFRSAVGEEGGIANLREPEMTVGHVFRAAFRNMVENYHRFALEISPTREWNRIVFSGGVAQKFEILRRMVCERFGVEHRLSASTEDSLLGLLALALVAGGRAGTVAAAVRMLSEERESGSRPRDRSGGLL